MKCKCEKCKRKMAQGTGLRAQGSEHRAQSMEHGAQGTELRAQGTEQRVGRLEMVWKAGKGICTDAVFN